MNGKLKLDFLNPVLSLYKMNRISIAFLCLLGVVVSSCSTDEVMVPLMAEEGEELSGGTTSSSNFSAELR